jgi:large subunit ribosomal protein L10
MSKFLEEKKRIVSEVRDKLEKSNSVVLVDYKGINVEDVTELRKRFREAGVDYKVYKNTLFKRATKDLGIDSLNDYLEGPTSFAFSYDDAVAPARTINQFIKDYPKTPITIKAGIVENNFMDAVSVKTLGDLPSREVLLAMLLGGLQGTMRNLAYMLNSIKEKKEAEAL